jgi:hypothetical protein
MTAVCQNMPLAWSPKQDRYSLCGDNAANTVADIMGGEIAFGDRVSAS